MKTEKIRNLKRSAVRKGVSVVCNLVYITQIQRKRQKDHLADPTKLHTEHEVHVGDEKKNVKIFIVFILNSLQ